MNLMKLYTFAFIGVIALFNPMMGTKNPADIPIPKKNFNVTLVDVEDNKLDLTSFSCDGEVYVKGTIGRAQTIIGFEKIKNADFFTDGSELKAKITLIDGNEIILGIKKTLPFYGKTSFGNIIIKAEDIKSIIFK